MYVILVQSWNVMYVLLDESSSVHEEDIKCASIHLVLGVEFRCVL